MHPVSSMSQLVYHPCLLQKTAELERIHVCWCPSITVKVFKIWESHLVQDKHSLAPAYRLTQAVALWRSWLWSLHGYKIQCLTPFLKYWCPFVIDWLTANKSKIFWHYLMCYYLTFTKENVKCLFQFLSVLLIQSKCVASDEMLVLSMRGGALSNCDGIFGRV